MNFPYLYDKRFNHGNQEKFPNIMITDICNTKGLKSCKLKVQFFLFLLFLIVIIPVSSLANNNCTHGKNIFRCVEYVKNYDGDTITFNIPGLHPLISKAIGIRVNGIDTAEIRTKSRCEKEKAVKAKIIVESELKKAKRIDLTNIGRGKYFRIVADVIVDTNSLADKLIKEGLAVPYNGGKKIKIDWCTLK